MYHKDRQTNGKSKEERRNNNRMDKKVIEKRMWRTVKDKT